MSLEDIDSSAKGDAAKFLVVTLSDGPVLEEELYSLAVQSGIEENSLKWAKSLLKIYPRKTKDSQRWFWEIPSQASVLPDQEHDEDYDYVEAFSDDSLNSLISFLHLDGPSDGNNQIAMNQMAMALWFERLAEKVDSEVPTIKQVDRYLHMIAKVEKATDPDSPSIGKVLAGNEVFLEIVVIWIAQGHNNVWGALQSVICNLGRYLVDLERTRVPRHTTLTSLRSPKSEREERQKRT